MELHDRLRSHLNGTADAVDVTPASHDHVQRRGRRRRRRSWAVGAVAVLAVVAGVAGGLALLTGGDPGSIEVADQAPDDGSGVPTTAAPAPAVTEAADESGPATGGPAPTMLVEQGDDSALESTYVGPMYLVPWQGGFLSIDVVSRPRPLPELSDEIVALFPQEVVDLFADDPPATIDEAIARLTEAGMIDVVNDIVTGNPDAYDAIYSEPPPAPELVVQRSADGVTWEPVDVGTLPFDTGSVGMVTSDGERLAVVVQEWDESTGESVGISLASTVDLVDWDLVELPLTRPADVPEQVRVHHYVQAVAVNDSGWVLAMGVSAEFDVYALLPESILQGRTDYGVSFESGGGGVTVEFYPEVTWEPILDEDGQVVGEQACLPDGTCVPAEDFDGYQEPVDTVFVSWEELGIDPAEADAYVGGEYVESVELWTSAWAAAPSSVAAPAQWVNQLIGTEAGFLLSGSGESGTEQLYFSPDGRTWAPTGRQPDDGGPSWTSVLTRIEGGVLVAVTTEQAGAEVFRADPRGEAWEPVTVPGLPTTSGFAPWSGPEAGSAPGYAAVVDAAPYPAYPVIEEVTVESDGYRVVMRTSGSTAGYELYDAEGRLVSSETIGWAEVGLGDEASLEDGPFEYAIEGPDGTTYLDPATGEELVTFSYEQIGQAWDEAARAAGWDPDVVVEPDLWLVATVDGRSWLVEDLAAEFDPGGPWPSFGPAAVSGSTVVVRTGTTWTTYPLD